MGAIFTKKHVEIFAIAAYVLAMSFIAWEMIK